MNSRTAKWWSLALLTAGLALSLTASASGAEGSFSRTLQVSGPVSLHIETGSGNITVRTGGASSVTVVGTIHATGLFFDDSAARVHRLEADPPIKQMENIIRIGEIRDPELRHNISISYEVTVPPETSLVSRTGSGDQSIEGLRRGVNAETGSGSLTLADLAGRLEVETGSGDVDVRRVDGRVKATTGSGTIRASGIAGPFWGHTGSGDVTVEQTAAGELEVETGSGEVEVQGARRAVKATTGSGNVRVEGQAGDVWNVSTGSGDVVLRLSGGFQLEAHTDSGSVRVGRPMQTSASDRHETRGTVGGGGNPVQVNTGSGDIRIE